jgi:hypothetical protein
MKKIKTVTNSCFLPDEIWVEILLFLTVKECCAIETTSKFIHLLIVEGVLPHKFCHGIELFEKEIIVSFFTYMSDNRFLSYSKKKASLTKYPGKPKNEAFLVCAFRGLPTIQKKLLLSYTEIYTHSTRKYIGMYVTVSCERCKKNTIPKNQKNFSKCKRCEKYICSKCKFVLKSKDYPQCTFCLEEFPFTVYCQSCYKILFNPKHMIKCKECPRLYCLRHDFCHCLCGYILD